VVRALDSLSAREIGSIVLALAPSVNGESRSILASIAERSGLLGKARDGVHSRRWSTRLSSARLLTAVGSGSDDALVLLRDPVPAVRAQAAAWVAARPSPPAIESVIALLRDSDGLCRFAAQDVLLRIGLPAVEALLGVLDNAEGDLAERSLAVAAALGDERFAAAAMTHTSSESPRLRAAAAAVLAGIGDPAAGPTLGMMLADPEAEVRRAAAAGIAEMAFWPAAAKVEALLDDPIWEVRKQAAVALLALGAPGLLLLRSTAAGESPSAHMAGQALELHSLALRTDAA
jgi:HEAT repeat protein